MTAKHTKIIATVSDLRCEKDFIQQLYNEGMNVVRMNTAHLKPEGALHIINNVRAVSNQIALLMDTKGPEIRTTVNAGGVDIEIKAGSSVHIAGKPDSESTADTICVSYTKIVEDLNIGDHILIDDGEIDLKVMSKTGEYLVCEALNDGSLGSRKSVNVPGVRICLPSLTEKDRNNILFAIEHDLDFIAHSFVRSKQDILDIQEILDAHNSEIKIIAKIENQEGVDNIDEILEVAYGVMVARGDLGIEIPQERIPGIQRQLIRKSVRAKKTVIVATQMLHSMIKNPRPTRAEITDIANAIYYRTDAIMLSGETAYGKYPVEAVRTMATVATEAEKTKMVENDIPIPDSEKDITLFLAKQAVKANAEIGTTATITDTYTGTTTRYLASFRAQNPVISICYKERTMRELALSYGVFPHFRQAEDGESTRHYFLSALQELRESGIVKDEDYIAYLGGTHGVGGGTNFLEIDQVYKLQ
ncbi:MAG: pyruvate kinase [Prevotellaceae bacterium]|jgi:pyruvate kinase|nr:pyruvate kinase [Prevotellaceae bacterium]